jgi:hypothetical protein
VVDCADNTLVNRALHTGALKVPELNEARLGQQIAHEVAQLGPHPDRQREPEPLLGPIDQVARQIACRDLAQNVLQLVFP